MHTSISKISRVLASIAVGIAFTTCVLIDSQAADRPTDPIKQEWVRHRQEVRKAHLAKLEARLEIKASQQGAWQSFVDAMIATSGTGVNRPQENADAATIAHYRADLAAAHAHKLAQIADATTKLQAVLTPDQRMTFDSVARRFLRRAHRHGMRGEHGRHE